MPSALFRITFLFVAWLGVELPRPAQAVESTAETQDPKQSLDAMGQARLLEEVEGDLAGAVTIYRKESDNPFVSEDTRREARLRLGLCLARLGRNEESRQALVRVAQGDDRLAKRAKAALNQSVESDRRLRGHVSRLLEEYISPVEVGFAGHRSADDSKQRAKETRTNAFQDLTAIGTPALPQIIERLDQEVSDIRTSKLLARLVLAIEGKEAEDYLKKRLSGNDRFMRRLFLSALHDYSPAPKSNLRAFWEARAQLDRDERERLAIRVSRSLDRNQLFELLRGGTVAERKAALTEAIDRDSLLADDEFRPVLVEAWYEDLRELGREGDNHLSFEYWSKLTDFQRFRYPEFRRAYLEFLMSPQNDIPRYPLTNRHGQVNLGVHSGTDCQLRATEVLEVARYWRSDPERRKLKWPGEVVRELSKHAQHWDRSEIDAAVEIAQLSHFWPDSPLAQLVFHRETSDEHLVALANRETQWILDHLWSRNSFAAYVSVAQEQLDSLIPDDPDNVDESFTQRFASRLLTLKTPGATDVLQRLWASEYYRGWIDEQLFEAPDEFLKWLVQQDDVATGARALEVLAHRGILVFDQITRISLAMEDEDDPLGRFTGTASDSESFDRSVWESALLPTIAAVTRNDPSDAWNILWRRTIAGGGSWIEHYPQIHRELLNVALKSDEASLRNWGEIAALEAGAPIDPSLTEELVDAVLVNPAQLKRGVSRILWNASIEPRLRRRAVDRIVDQPDSRLVDLLIRWRKSTPVDVDQVQRLLGHSNAGIRLKALDGFWNVLRQADREAPVPQVLETLMEDPSFRVRMRALQLGWKLDRESLIPRVIGSLQDPSAEVRLCALGMLQEYPEPRAADALIRLLRDPENSVRKATQVTLNALKEYEDTRDRWIERSRTAKLDSESAVSTLVGQMQSPNPKEVRLAAIRSAPAMKKPELLPFLVELVRDSDPDIRQAASRSIDKIAAAEE